MTLIDAYGLVALAANETAANEVESLLRSGDAAVPVVNLAEAIDVCRRTHGLDSAQLRRRFDLLILTGGLAAVSSTEEHAWRAGDIRASHYHRTARPLSIADCLLLAHALLAGGAVATADPHLADLARGLGVELVPLPDRAGKRP